MLVSHRHRAEPEASSFGTNVETIEDDNGLRDDLLWQPEEYAGSLGELGAGEAERALEVGGYPIKLGAGGRELFDCNEGIGKRGELFGFWCHCQDWLEVLQAVGPT